MHFYFCFRAIYLEHGTVLSHFNLRLEGVNVCTEKFTMVVKIDAYRRHSAQDRAPKGYRCSRRVFVEMQGEEAHRVRALTPCPGIAVWRQDPCGQTVA